MGACQVKVAGAIVTIREGEFMAKSEWYQAKQFKLSGLHGISDQTLEMHFKLYEGYVKRPTG
jgi:hypothetical protein